MKTYVETQNEQPFDWNAFLDMETITNEEWEQAEELASCWVTCACGNQCDIIPRTSAGIPRDNMLSFFGQTFWQYVYTRDKVKAKNILGEIEKRSVELIEQISVQRGFKNVPNLK